MDKTGPSSVRQTAVLAALFLCVCLIVFKLFWIYFVDGDRYRRIAAQQRALNDHVTGLRGTIFDRNGEILAVSEKVSTVFASPSYVDDKRFAANKLAPLLKVEASEIKGKLESGEQYVVLKTNVDGATVTAIRKMLTEEQIAGIGFEDTATRDYPQGHLAAQILGLVGEELAGISGLELQYDELLSGKTGEIYRERDAKGCIIPGTEMVLSKPEDGSDIRITIDREIQAKVEQVLAEGLQRYSASNGTGIVLDCNNGDILAMASSPGYDPNDRSKLDPEFLRNRAVTDAYEPGSVMKIVTATAALEEGVVQPDTSIFVPSEYHLYDSTFKDSEVRPSRHLTFREIIGESSNVGTIEVGVELGKERLFQHLQRFGFSAPTGIDFPGESAGRVPEVSDWSGTSIATISIGHGITATPIQIAAALGSIANGGHSITPHFLLGTDDGSGEKDVGVGGLGDTVISDTVCKQMSEILSNVVSEGNTGTNAAVNFYDVAGKTGTAAKPSASGYLSQYMATFVGYAPVSQPRLVCLVLFDNPVPIYGGQTSACAFSEIMQFALQKLDVPATSDLLTNPAGNGDNRAVTTD